MAGDWAYDLARHRALVALYRREAQEALLTLGEAREALLTLGEARGALLTLGEAREALAVGRRPPNAAKP